MYLKNLHAAPGDKNANDANIHWYSAMKSQPNTKNVNASHNF